MQLISKYLPVFQTSCWDMLESLKNFESESLPFWETLLLVSKGSTNSVSNFSSAVCQPWPCGHFGPGTPCHGGSVYYRIFSKVLDLYPLEANSIPPTCDCKKSLQTLPHAPWGATPTSWQASFLDSMLVAHSLKNKYTTGLIKCGHGPMWTICKIWLTADIRGSPPSPPNI